CTLSSGMVLGREGPSVQIGGNLGKMVADIFRLPKEHGHALLAAGAAGGLAAAFNAPLAGILFVMEEMRPQFRYSFLAIKAVGISAIMATLMLQNMKGQAPVISLPHYDAPALKALWLFLFMGATFGVLGFVFNKLVLACQDAYLALHQNKRHRFVAIGMLVAGTFGVLSLFAPSVTGGGTELIPHLMGGEYAMATLFLIFS
ncbi:chloride channel protein, partial [Aeromonas piscicola]